MPTPLGPPPGPPPGAPPSPKGPAPPPPGAPPPDQSRSTSSRRSGNGNGNAFDPPAPSFTAVSFFSSSSLAFAAARAPPPATTGCASPLTSVPLSRINSCTRKPRSGASVWWLPTRSTGAPFVPKGTASMPWTICPFALVEKNTGDVILRSGSRDSNALSSSAADGGMNPSSFESGGGSCSALGLNPFLAITSRRSHSSFWSAACEAPSRTSTRHRGISRRSLGPSSPLGMSRSSELATQSAGTSMERSAPGALTTSHPAASTDSRCASVSRGMTAVSAPSVGNCDPSASTSASMESPNASAPPTPFDTILPTSGTGTPNGPSTASPDALAALATASRPPVMSAAGSKSTGASA
mmetsp:Transcript_7205/g.31788  ORF Transcript_7205/g.31788 Transcript_7205/m.31788 type:complete len:354 (+) Transcript_7205:732-1793(+)